MKAGTNNRAANGLKAPFPKEWASMFWRAGDRKFLRDDALRVFLQGLHDKIKAGEVVSFGCGSFDISASISQKAPNDCYFVDVSAHGVTRASSMGFLTQLMPGSLASMAICVKDQLLAGIYEESARSMHRLN